MADLDRELFLLLDAAAEAPTADPPVHELIRRGTSRRRARVAGAIGAVAAATTAILVGVSVLVPAGGDHGTPPTGHRNLTPPPTVAPELPAGPTAEQLAHGTWVNVAAAPIPLCDGTATAWGDSGLLVVSPACERMGTGGGALAALYDPASNSWRSLPDLPRVHGELHAVATEDGYVVVAPAAGVAALLPADAGNRPNGTTPGGWTLLPDLPADPASLSDDAITAVAGGVVVAGLGSAGDEVAALIGRRWSALPSLPHAPGHTLPAVGLGTLGRTVYADVTDEVVLTQDGSGTSLSARARLLRLDGDHWTELPRSHRQPPFVVDRMEQFGDRLLVVGGNCPPGTDCLAAGTSANLVSVDGHLVTLDPSPLGLGSTDVLATGRALLAYDSYSRGIGAGGARPGDTALWDPDTGRWRRGPSSVLVQDVAATAWTPYGFIVLGDPVEKCACSLGGLILKPARK